jgi:hypothetical protein
MKKVSTAAVMQSRNFSVQQKLTIGLDLGDRRSWYCVLDEAGKVQACAISSLLSGDYECNGDVTPTTAKSLLILVAVVCPPGSARFSVSVQVDPRVLFDPRKLGPDFEHRSPAVSTAIDGCAVEVARRVLGQT